MNLNPSIRRWFYLFLLIGAVNFWAIVGRVLDPDANFITYRFAANLAAGRGLVYWMPGAIFPPVSTFPIVPSLLALLSISSASIPLLGGIVSVAAIIVGAIYLSRLTNIIAGLFYVFIAAGQPAPVTMTMIALSLAGIDAASRQRWTLSGILIGVAILTEPSAIPLALLLIFYILRSGGSIRRYMLPAVLIPTAGLLIVSRSLDPGGAGIVSLVPGIVVVALPILALVALVWKSSVLRQVPIVAILAAWSAVIGLIALIGNTWPNAAILPGALVLIAILPIRMQLLGLVAACIDVVIAFSVLKPPPLEPGTWIAANTGPNTTIATSEIGALAYYAARPVIDLSGKIQPNAFDEGFFLRNAPDAIVLKDGAVSPWEPFATTYAKLQSSNGLNYFQRVVNFSPFDDHGVDVNYSAQVGRADLRLVNVALGNTLHPGDLVRVRLDWEFAFPQPQREMAVKLTLLTEQGQPIVGRVDKIPPGKLPAGKVSTYHVLPLPGDVKDGKVSLYLGVSIGSFSSTELSVAAVSVRH